VLTARTEHDVVAVGSEPQRGRLPDAAARAGHCDDLAHGGDSSLRWVDPRLAGTAAAEEAEDFLGAGHPPSAAGGGIGGTPMWGCLLIGPARGRQAQPPFPGAARAVDRAPTHRSGG